MGNARARGTFEERKVEAVKFATVREREVPKDVRLAAVNIRREEGKLSDGGPRFFIDKVRNGYQKSQDGKFYVVKGGTLRRATEEESAKFAEMEKNKK